MKHVTLGLLGWCMILTASTASAQDYAKQRALNQLQQVRLQQLRMCETRGFNDYGLQQCRAAVDSWAEEQRLNIEGQDIAYQEQQQRRQQKMRDLQMLRDQLQEAISPGSTRGRGCCPACRSSCSAAGRGRCEALRAGRPAAASRGPAARRRAGRSRAAGPSRSPSGRSSGPRPLSPGSGTSTSP